MAINQNDKIFITGATGFLGCYLVKKLLSEGYKNIYCCLHTLKNKIRLSEISDKVTWLEGDILDITYVDESLKDIDIVIHTAAIVSFENRIKDLMIKVADEGTENLVNYSLKHGIKKFIHISSVAALGRNKLEEIIDETKIFSHSKYDSTYGLSKFLAEQQVWRGQAEGLDVVILNPSTILGQSQFESSAKKIVNKLKLGLSFYPEGLTGWVDVNDVTQAIVNVIKKGITNERIIISSENRTYHEVLFLLSTALKLQPPTQVITPRIGKIILLIEKIKTVFSRKPTIISKDSLMSTKLINHYDNSKSISLLGMEYKNINQSIIDMVS